MRANSDALKALQRSMLNGLKEALNKIPLKRETTLALQTKDFFTALPQLSTITDTYTLFSDLDKVYPVENIQKILKIMGINDNNIENLLFTKHPASEKFYKIQPLPNDKTQNQYIDYLKNTVIKKYLKTAGGQIRHGIEESIEKADFIENTHRFIDLLYMNPKERQVKSREYANMLNIESAKLFDIYKLDVADHKKFTKLLAAVINELKVHPENVLEFIASDNNEYPWRIKTDFLAPYLTSYSSRELADNLHITASTNKDYFLKVPGNRYVLRPDKDKDIIRELFPSAKQKTLQEKMVRDFDLIRALKDFMIQNRHVPQKAAS